MNTKAILAVILPKLPRASKECSTNLQAASTRRKYLFLVPRDSKQIISKSNVRSKYVGNDFLISFYLLTLSHFFIAVIVIRATNVKSMTCDYEEKNRCNQNCVQKDKGTCFQSCQVLQFDMQWTDMSTELQFWRL